MLEIESLSKDAVYTIMRELLYSLNYMGIKYEDLMRKKYPEDFKGEMARLYEEFGAYEARRISEVLSISEEGINALIKLLKHSHWAVFENIDVEKLTEKSFRMRTIECSAQKAAKRQGIEYYDCSEESPLLLRSGFFKVVSQKAKVQRVFAPPEPRPAGIPENVSCEWLILIED